MSSSFYWNGVAVPFREGETVAYALFRASGGKTNLGHSSTGQAMKLFCGIGTCQGCLVRILDRGTVEACLVIAREGLEVMSIGARDDAESASLDASHE